MGFHFLFLSFVFFLFQSFWRTLSMIHYIEAPNFVRCEPGRAFYLLWSSQQHFKWYEIDRAAGRILVHCCRAHCTGEQKAQHMASPSSSAGIRFVLGKNKALTNMSHQKRTGASGDYLLWLSLENRVLDCIFQLAKHHHSHLLHPLLFSNVSFELGTPTLHQAHRLHRRV